MSGDVEALRDALASWAKSEPRTDFNEAECRKVLDVAGVDVPEDRFGNVALTFKRLPFYGGNYTLDAKRLLRAALPAEPTGGDA